MNAKRNRMKMWGVVGAVCVVLLCAGGWYVYDSWYRIPSGLPLPPAAPARTFSEEAIALNQQACDVGMEDGSEYTEEALRLYDEAIAADPNFHTAYANKATLLVKLKRYEEASACLEKLKALRPRVAEYYVPSAFCNDRLGRPERAREDLLKALTVYNDSVAASPFWARLNRAPVLYLLGNERVARTELRRLEKEQTDPRLRSLVAGLREEMEKPSGAGPWSILGFE